MAAFKRALGRRTFDLVVDCHEDEDAPGLYVFAPPRLGRPVVAAAGAIGPVHPGPLVDGELPLSGGVIELDAARAEAQRRTWLHWPLPFYLGLRRLAHAEATRPERILPDTTGVEELAWVTIETPTRLPFEQRVAMHLAAIDAAVDGATVAG